MASRDTAVAPFARARPQRSTLGQIKALTPTWCKRGGRNNGIANVVTHTRRTCERGHRSSSIVAAAAAAIAAATTAVAAAAAAAAAALFCPTTVMVKL